MPANLEESSSPNTAPAIAHTDSHSSSVVDSNVVVLLSTPTHTEADELKERHRRKQKAKQELGKHGNLTRLDWSGSRNPYASGPIKSTVITISSDEEDSRPGLQPTTVPFQRTYTSNGSNRVISSSLAAVPCVQLGLSGMLDKLNEILGTSYSLDLPSLAVNLETCISRSYDFGTAFSRLLPNWYMDFTPMAEELASAEANDLKMRTEAVVSNEIQSSFIHPRRVWDLWSNRVIPTWLIKRPYWAVSHCWMHPSRRIGVMTPINGYEWPVPIPDDTTLERIRIELLNIGAQYVWLDVLCLRQRGSAEKEPIRIEEWKLDVPTIGHVYHQNQQIIHYYSGLGRPFEIGDMEGERHWLNRAWTLQEISENSTIGGVTDNSLVNPVFDDNGVYEDPLAGEFYRRLASIRGIAQGVDNVFAALALMQKRAAESEIDKVAGLSHLLRAKPIPAYYETQSPEDAWMRLVEKMLPNHRGDLLLLFPMPSDLEGERPKWVPSWNQIMKAKLPSTGGTYMFQRVFCADDPEAPGYFYHKGYRVDGCMILGLADPDPDEKRRTGALIVRDKKGERHTFRAFAFHQHPIPDGLYMIDGDQSLHCCAVSRLKARGVLEKVSVIRLETNESAQIINMGIGGWRNSYYA